MLSFVLVLLGSGITDADRLDAIARMPYIVGRDDWPPREAFYWRFKQDFAIREAGPWWHAR